MTKALPKKRHTHLRISVFDHTHAFNLNLTVMKCVCAPKGNVLACQVLVRDSCCCCSMNIKQVENDGTGI